VGEKYKNVALDLNSSKDSEHYSIFPEIISLATRQADIRYINIRIIQNIDD